MYQSRRKVGKIKKLRRYLYFLSAQVVVRFLRFLPMGWAIRCGRYGGRMAFFLVREERKRAFEHLERAIGDGTTAYERYHIVRDMFENFGHVFVESLFLPQIMAEGVNNLVDGDGVREVMEELLAEGQGLVTLTAHMSNWELLCAWATPFLKANVVARKVYVDQINNFVVSLREELGITTFYQNEPKKMLRALQRGEMVGMLADQDVRRIQGRYIPFFHQTAYTPTGPVALSWSAKSPLLPIFIVREKSGKYRVECASPLWPDREKETKAEWVYRSLLHWSKFLEDLIKRYPHQWCWNHRRWKTRITRFPREMWDRLLPPGGGLGE